MKEKNVVGRSFFTQHWKTFIPCAASDDSRSKWFGMPLLFILLLALVVTALGCERKGSSSAYKVVDSGIWPYASSFEKTFWLDSKQVLFLSNEKLQPGGGSKKITSWNSVTGRVEFFQKAKNLICVQDGQVLFSLKGETSGEFKHYRGPLGNPQEHLAPSPDMRLDDRFDCDWAPNFSRAKVPYRIKLKDANYLEIQKEKTYALDNSVSQGVSAYYERLDLPPISLPIHVDLEGSYRIVFSPLRNAYFLSPREYVPDDPYYHSLWWLQRDGRLTQEHLPQDVPWPSRGGIEVHPLRDGYLVLYQGGGTNSMTNTGSRGLYLIRNDEVETVLLGELHGLGISPDGCRAAFVHAKNTKEYISAIKPYRTVKSINFCDDREGQ